MMYFINQNQFLEISKALGNEDFNVQQISKQHLSYLPNNPYKYIMADLNESIQLIDSGNFRDTKILISSIIASMSLENYKITESNDIEEDFLNKNQINMFDQT